MRLLIQSAPKPPHAPRCTPNASSMDRESPWSSMDNSNNALQRFLKSYLVFQNHITFCNRRHVFFSNRSHVFCCSLFRAFEPPLEVRKERGSWQARRFVRNFDADLVGCVLGGHFLRQKIVLQQKTLELRSRSDETAVEKHNKSNILQKGGSPRAHIRWN